MQRSLLSTFSIDSADKITNKKLMVKQYEEITWYKKETSDDNHHKVLAGLKLWFIV
ncbi:MAG: hypothetical protein WCE90_12450 [Candidatus Zixiibacteriota bacterium]